MNFYKISNAENKIILWDRARITFSFISRLVGLMGRRTMREEEALIFYKANMFHTCFMRFAIDIIFCDQDMKILKITEKLRPFKFTSCKKAYCAIEVCAGSSQRKHLEPGMILLVKPH